MEVGEVLRLCGPAPKTKALNFFEKSNLVLNAFVLKGYQRSAYESNCSNISFFWFKMTCSFFINLKDLPF